jgi:hypothetical protein
VQNRTKLSVTAIGLLLGACGGGGGSGGGSSSNTPAPSVKITSANAERVTETAIGAVTLSQSGSAGLSGVDGTAQPAAAQAASRAARALRAHARPQAEVPVSGVCDTPPNGQPLGSLSGKFNDANNDLDLTQGDTIEATFTNCYLADVDGTFGGKVTMRVNSASSPDPNDPFAVGSSLGLAVSFTGLSVDIAGSAKDYTMDGSLTASINQTSASATTTTLKGGPLTVKTNDDTVTYTNADYLSVEDASGYTISGSSTATSQKLGTINLNIPAATPLKGTYAGVTTSGSMTITGDNSRLVASAGANNTVRLQIDENNDGSFDAEKTVTWDDIIL